MNQPTLQRDRQGVDYGEEQNVQKLHAAIQREKGDGRITIKPFPLWILVICGFVFFFVGLLSALMQGVLIGPLIRVLGEERLLLAGLGLIALGLLLMPFVHTVPMLIVAMTALALGIGAAQPSINSLISRHAGVEQQGEVMGVSQSVGSLSRVLGPIAAGSLFEAVGHNAPFVWGAVLVAGALLVGWRLQRGLAIPIAASPQPPLGPAQ